MERCNALYVRLVSLLSEHAQPLETQCVILPARQACLEPSIPMVFASLAKWVPTLETGGLPPVLTAHLDDIQTLLGLWLVHYVLLAIPHHSRLDS